MIGRRFCNRPLVSRRYIGAWIVLLATLPLGIRSYHLDHQIGLGTWEPGRIGDAGYTLGANYYTYHHAGARALAGEPFYDVALPPTFDWAVYLYPPITVIAYYPFTLVDWTTGFAILTMLSILASVIATILITDYIEEFGTQLGWIDLLFILSAFLISTHAYGTIHFGNINLLLAFAFVLGFWALSRDRELLAGTVFAVAALFKVFPAFIGLWLLRDRRWRATGVALAIGIGGILSGIVLFGFGTTIHYFSEILAGRGRGQRYQFLPSPFIGGYQGGMEYITIQQPLSKVLWTVWPTATYDALVTLTIVVCIPVLAYFYWDLETQIDRLMAMFVTVVVMIVLFPSLRWYLVLMYFPFISMLYVWDTGPGRIAFITGGIFTSLSFSTPAAIHLFSWWPEPFFSIWSATVSLAKPPLIGMLLMVAACAYYRHRTTDRNAHPLAPTERT